MAYISKIKPNGAQGTEYDLKDATARSAIENTNRNIQSSITPAKAAVVTVTDAAPINAEDITVDIEPIQDLHGYDRPWAGGAGKNKATDVFSDFTNPDNYYICPITLQVGRTYTIYATKTGQTVTNAIYGFVRDGDRYSNFVGQRNVINIEGSVSNLTFTVDDTFVSPKLVFYGNESKFNSIFANYQIQLEESNQATPYAPYSNICPIEGWTGAELTQKDAATNPTVTRIYTADFGETVYGGKWHVNEGGTDKTHGNIASYNGETINEPWLSSMDEYSPGATPTIGAQVVYPLTTPTTISTPKQNVPMLQGINTVYADCGDTQLKYQPDNVIGELKGKIEGKASAESIAITAGDGTNERSFTFNKKPLSIMVSYAAVGTYLQMFIVWGQSQYAFQAKSTNGQTPSVGLVTVNFDDDTNTMTITGSSQYDSISALNHAGGSGVMAVTYKE